MSVNGESEDGYDLHEKKNSVGSDEPSRASRAMSFAPDDLMDIDANVQYAGILKKPPFGKSYGRMTRWTERFCVVKESFLLYYDKSEKKAYDTKKMFNIHPKGVIPLAGSTVEAFDDLGKFCFRIKHATFKTGNLVLATRNGDDRDNWVSILQECSKVTWNNAQLGNALIKQLEENTARINKEKKEYIEKLQAEAELLKHEKGKKEELEALAKQLEEEKEKMEGIANKFKEEKEMTQGELMDAMSAMKELDAERSEIDNKAKELQNNLKTLEAEKRTADELLKDREALADQLLDEKKHLLTSSTNLKSHLAALEDAARQLEEEKMRTQLELADNEEKAKMFEEERKGLHRAATSLQLNLEEVNAKKAQTEADLTQTASNLEKEKLEKKKLEKRLRLAEDSLKRLDAALRDSGIKVSLEIEADVTTLKSFFEEAAADAQLQAQRHKLMEEAVRAKKTYEQRAFKKAPHRPDVSSAKENFTRVENKDPRLLGESQSTIQPPEAPDNQIAEATNEEKEAKLDFSEENVEEEKLDLPEGKMDLSKAKVDFPEVSEKELEVSEKEVDSSEKEADSSVEKVEKVDLPEKLSSPSPTLPTNEKPAEEEEDSNRNVTSPVVLESVVLDSVEQGS